MNPVLLLDIVGITLAFTFLVILNITRSGVGQAKNALNIILTVALLLTIVNLLTITNQFVFVPYLFIILFPLLYTIYPMVNIYINSIVEKDKNPLIHYNHFIIPLLVFLVLLGTLLFLPKTDFLHLINLQEFYNDNFSITTELISWFLFGIYYFQFLYFLFIFMKLKKRLKNKSFESFEFSLVRYIVFIMVFYEVFTLFTFFINQHILLVDIIITDLIILLIGIGGLKHDQILLELQISASVKTRPVLSAERRFKGKIHEGKQKQIVFALQQLVQKEKLYLNPNLRIGNFVRKLNMSEKDLSIIINDILGKSFSTFIDEFRISEACLLLAQPNAKISEVSYKVGFFSKSTFNNTFKEFTGQTPTEYKNSIQ